MPPVTESFDRDPLDNLTDGVYFVDRNRVITCWNRGAERISGHCGPQMIGAPCHEGPLQHVDEAGRRLCGDGRPLAATIDDGAVREAEVYLQHRDGHRVPVIVRAAPIRDEHGEIVGAVETFVDNSGKVAALRKVAQLEDHAFVDPLTGVGNRRYAETMIADRLSELGRHGRPFGLLFVDVDRFKAVNDTHGHETGDRVLQTVARSLSGGLRTHDFVGRWGGEEFVVLLVGAGAGDLAACAERLRMLVGQSAAAGPGGPVRVTVSIGATLARPGEPGETLIARADALMYRAKAAGRDRVCL